MATARNRSSSQSDYESKFNTVLWNKLGSGQKQKVAYTPLDVIPGDIQYARLPPFPRIYDPRTPATMPEEEYKNWFFRDADNHVVSVIALPLDQGKCGSDWAFATASMFTDTIRHALMTIFGDQACFYSKLFDPIQTCTGEVGVESLIQGLEKAGTGQKCKRDDECPSGDCLPSGQCLDLVSVEVRDRISVYYTVGFAPKLKATCKSSDELSDCFLDCGEIYAEWKMALTTRATLPRATSSSEPRRAPCSGCEGNAIVMPLYMFVESGAPLLSDFPVQEWGCIFGTDAMRKTFCTEEFLKAGATRPLPQLIQADRYGHFVQEDAKNNRPAGINNMEEWMMAEILNNASITVGFVIYPCFFQFFLENPNGVFTSKVLQNAIKKGSQEAAGGHAVDVIGWAEDMVDGELTQFWIVRNSWGEKWGDKGFFRFERGLDAKLLEAKLEGYLTQFENEFGTLYYAPFPNPNLYGPDDYVTLQVGGQNIQISKRLSKIVRLPPVSQCESVRLNDQANVKQLRKCECQPGYVKNTQNICVRDLSSSYSLGTLRGKEKNWGWLLILIALLAIGLGLLTWKLSK